MSVVLTVYIIVNDSRPQGGVIWWRMSFCLTVIKVPSISSERTRKLTKLKPRFEVLFVAKELHLQTKEKKDLNDETSVTLQMNIMGNYSRITFSEDTELYSGEILFYQWCYNVVHGIPNFKDWRSKQPRPPRVFVILKMAAGSKTPWEMQQNTPRIVEYFIMRHTLDFRLHCNLLYLILENV